ncbi:retrovirus-related pol polyprotein from transposon TNT 1-94 [Tanacetum coccineum]|uniref:Retrovirus-related pol polyprotein from transposon TNT 1-94 n=1 Tax=Tanacetum coccineum TaxID=301880 RepID=A0ABQ5A892_9ASTR
MENLEFYDKHNIVNWEYILLGMTEAKDSEVCKITRADGSSSFHGDIQALLRRLDRQDLSQLYSLVQERFKDHPLEGHDLDLWGDLRMIFDPNDEDDIWLNQQYWELLRWKLHEYIGVHSLFLDGTSIQINMLVEKKYPLKKEILEKMINLKIEAEEERKEAKVFERILSKSKSFNSRNLRFEVDNGKSVSVPFGAHMKVSLKDCLSSDWDVERMSKVKYVNVVGLVYSTGKHVDVDGFVDANYAKELDNGGSITGVMVLTEAVNESIWLKSLRIKLGVNQLECRVGDIDVVLLTYRICGVDLRFGMEELCLVTGLRFRPKFDLSFEVGDFRRRVFPPKSDGSSITIRHLYKKIKSVDCLSLDHRDAVKLCLLGILMCVFLGRDFEYVVPKFLFKLANNLEAWNLFLWGSFIWKDVLYEYLRDAWLKRRKAVSLKKPQYSLQGFVWAFKVTDIAQKDKNEAKWTKPGMGIERVQEIKAEGTFIFKPGLNS